MLFVLHEGRIVTFFSRCGLAPELRFGLLLEHHVVAENAGQDDFRLHTEGRTQGGQREKDFFHGWYGLDFFEFYGEVAQDRRLEGDAVTRGDLRTALENVAACGGDHRMWLSE